MEELYRAWGPVVFSRCRRLLGTDAAAADAAQVVFRRVTRDLGGDPRVALHRVYDAADAYCRREWTRPRPALDDEERAGEHLPRELIDASLSGCADEEERRVLDAHLEGCDACRRAKATLAGDRHRFLDRHFEPTLALVERDARAPAAARWILWFAPVMVSCVMLAMVLFLRMPHERRAPQLFVEGAAAGSFRGDRPLELRVEPAGATEVVLAAVDASGDVRFLQPGAVRLAGPPGTVRLVAVFARGPIAPAAIAQRLHDEAARGDLALRSDPPPSIPGATAIAVVLERR